MGDFVTRENQTEEKLKRAFRSKPLELCKTRTKKSCSHIFNFFVDLAGEDMVTNTGRATKCRRKFKALSLQIKRTKKKVISKTLVLTENNLKILNKKTLLASPKQSHQTLLPLQGLTTDFVTLCNQEEKNRRRTGKSIQNKTVRFSKSRIKIFYVDLASQDMITDAVRATTCKHEINAP